METNKLLHAFYYWGNKLSVSNQQEAKIKDVLRQGSCPKTDKGLAIDPHIWKRFNEGGLWLGTRSQTNK